MNNNEIKVFINDDFGEIRAMNINGDPWFVGKDIATVLGYINPLKAVRTHVDEEDKGVNEMDTPGGKQKIIVINESGLYSLILSSKLPTAKKFKRWVTSEVLPAIRKYGGYIPGNTQEEIEQKAKEIADSMVKDLKDENKRLQINCNSYIRSNEDATFSEYTMGEYIDKMSDILIDYLTYKKKDKYSVENVIDKCGVSYQTIIDTLYRAGWIFFDSYNVPQFNPLYLMNITPYIVFNTDGFNTIVAYFNNKKNRVPKLIYHDKNEK